MNRDWISAKDRAPEFPCVVWNGQDFDVPKGLLGRKINGKMRYYDTALMEGTYKEIMARDFSMEREVRLWMPLFPLPKEELENDAERKSDAGATCNSGESRSPDCSDGK